MFARSCVTTLYFFSPFAKQSLRSAAVGLSFCFADSRHDETPSATADSCDRFFSFVKSSSEPPEKSDGNYCHASSYMDMGVSKVD